MATTSAAATATDLNDVGALLRTFGRDQDRGRSLRAQLTARFPDRPAEEVEDAVQTACRCFLDEAEGISAPAQAYAWIRTAAYHSLIREAEHRGRVIAVDPSAGALEAAVSEEPGPAEELIALEDEADLEVLIREFSSSLSPRRRQILALWGAGLKRPEIAAQLGLSERGVKRDLLVIVEKARGAVAAKAGGGCASGEPLVLRLACGLASAPEAEQARAHLDRCGRCAAFSEQLGAWREKAAALLPPAAVEGASPGVLEHVAHRVADGFASVKQQILGGGAQLKQQSTAAYSRAVDPTPLAGVRPGAVAAVVAGCLAVGGGATYCAQHGVDPIGAATDLIAGSQESEPQPAAPPAEGPTYTPAPPPPTQEPATTGTTSEPPPAEAPPPEPKPEPEPEPPPPEASFEPSSPDYPTEAPPEAASAPAPSPKPAPVPANEAPQFGGP
jgi:RNA polymerase sigma factor (sigma-70 family)